VALVAEAVAVLANMAASALEGEVRGRRRSPPATGSAARSSTSASRRWPRSGTTPSRPPAS